MVKTRGAEVLSPPVVLPRVVLGVSPVLLVVTALKVLLLGVSVVNVLATAVGSLGEVVEGRVVGVAVFVCVNWTGSEVASLAKEGGCPPDGVIGSPGAEVARTVLVASGVVAPGTEAGEMKAGVVVVGTSVELVDATVIPTKRNEDKLRMPAVL